MAAPDIVLHGSEPNQYRNDAVNPRPKLKRL